MMKKIVYRSIGALLSMVMLCGCAAKDNSGAVSDDAETFASSTVEESATEDVAEIAGDMSEDLPYWKTVGLSEYESDYSPVNTEDTFYNTNVVDKPANNLTYEGAMVAVADLIAKYGVDSLISSSGSFEEDFGISSDEYIQNYVDSKEYMHFLEE